MEPKLTRTAKLQAERTWIQWAEQQIKRRRGTAARMETTGYYQGYSADRERHRITLLSGRPVLAQSLTTSGQSGGQVVAVTHGDVIRFKTIPR